MPPFTPKFRFQIEYAGLLLKMKLATTRRTAKAAAIAGAVNANANNGGGGGSGGSPNNSRENSVMLNGNFENIRTPAFA